VPVEYPDKSRRITALVTVLERAHGELDPRLEIVLDSYISVKVIRKVKHPETSFLVASGTTLF